MAAAQNFTIAPISTILILSPPGAWLPGTGLDQNPTSTAVFTNIAGASLTYAFIGSETAVVGDANRNSIISVTIDGRAQQIRPGQGNSPGLDLRTLFQRRNLDPRTTHTVQVALVNNVPGFYISSIQFIGTPVSLVAPQPAVPSTPLAPTPSMPIIGGLGALPIGPTALPTITGSASSALPQTRNVTRAAVIAGAVIGSIGFVVLVVVGIWLFRRRQFSWGSLGRNRKLGMSRSALIAALDMAEDDRGSMKQRSFSSQYPADWSEQDSSQQPRRASPDRQRPTDALRSKKSTRRGKSIDEQRRADEGLPQPGRPYAGIPPHPDEGSPSWIMMS